MIQRVFYEEYWLKRKGEHLVSVCRSIACEFCGQPAITQAVKDALGIDVGETTDDGVFTLIELECLGSCGTAPALLIDETLHENVKPEQVGAFGGGAEERKRASLNAECGMRNAECGMRNAECGMRNAESGSGLRGSCFG